MSDFTPVKKKALHKDMLNYVSSSLNLPKKTLKDIVSMYIGLQQHILLSGNSIYFSDYAMIKVEKPKTEYMYSTAILGASISKELNLPLNTTIQALNKYLSSIKAIAFMGYSTGIQSLIRITPVGISEDGYSIGKVRSGISPFLLEDLRLKGITARVSIKNFRDSLQFSNYNPTSDKELKQLLKYVCTEADEETESTYKPNSSYKDDLDDELDPKILDRIPVLDLVVKHAR